MKIKKKYEKAYNFLDKLSWYVLLHNFNKDEIYQFNIFNSTNFCYHVAKALTDYVDYVTFYKDVDDAARYSFWSKAEYEIMCCGLFVDEPDRMYKVSVYDQIEKNMGLIVKYIFDEYNKTKRVKLK